jgi:hypothetical protein
MLSTQRWLATIAPRGECASGVLVAAHLLLAVSVGTCQASACRPPAYREGYILEDLPSSIWMNISVDTSNFAPERLICLAAALRQRYSDRRQISVVVFSSFAAAKGFKTPFTGESLKRSTNWSLENHALYSYDADKHEEYVTIMPLGQTRLFETKINLPAVSTPPCTLEMAGRCLLALSKIEYPWDALKTHVSGAVTLEAEIARDGTITAVKSAGAGPSGQEQASLINAAIQNLKSWRFETASRRDALRIVYSFTIDTSGTLGQPSLQFDLPDKVEIRGHLPQ